MHTVVRSSIVTCLAGTAMLLTHCTSSDAGPFAGDTADSGPVVTGDGAVPDGSLSEPIRDCAKHCSEDLSQVLDCHDAVVETCAGSTGCGGGACVPACEASKANFSNVGCEFVVPRPVTLEPNTCHALIVSNAWRTPAKIDVVFDGQKLPFEGHAVSAEDGAPIANGTIAPGQIAIVVLAGRNCGPAAMIDEPSVLRRVAGRNESGRTHAFVITADVPVQIRDVDALGDREVASKSSALLAATTTWDRDYVVAMPTPLEGEYAGGVVQIVAREDSVVELRPREDVVGAPDLLPVKASQFRSYRLGRGEVLQFVQDGDLTGSFIHANTPVGVFAGAANFMVKSGWEAAHVQLSPTRSLGDRYVGVRHRDRYDGKVESARWRIVGVVGGTTLTYSPAAPLNAPTKLEAGEFVEFEATEPFTVSSQDAEHAFAMYAFMTSPVPYMAPGDDPSFGDLRGDPEFTPVIPVVQYMKRYRFYTDTFFPETNVVIVRRRGSGGFADVDLDCAGKLTGWSPVGTDGDLELTRIDLSRGNYEPQGNCKNGVHEMRSDAPFTATVWGWGGKATGGGELPGTFTRGSSYAFPVGAGFRPVNTVELPGGIR